MIDLLLSEITVHVIQMMQIIMHVVVTLPCMVWRGCRNEQPWLHMHTQTVHKLLVTRGDFVCHGGKQKTAACRVIDLGLVARVQIPVVAGGLFLPQRKGESGFSEYARSQPPA